MKEVLTFIESKKQEYAQLPLFEFMRDKSIDPKQRLAWAPCFAPLAMNFTDLNRHVFRKEPTNNKIQEIINRQTYQEETHYLWFLQDLKKLGFDHSQNFSDSLKFMWSEETDKTRLTCLQTALLTFQADPILVLAVIEVIEATAHVIFSHTTQVAEELQKITNQKYVFFGQHHSDEEVIHFDDIQQFLESIELTYEQKAKAFEMITKEFEIVTEFTNELMAYAEKYPVKEQLKAA